MKAPENRLACLAQFW